MKNQKLWLKLLLDLVLLIILTLLLWKDNFGMEFHEIAGITILGGFLLHVLLNWRWVYQMTKRLFDKNVTIRGRISWLINLGLLICFALIGISGVFMSRVLFGFSVKENWKTVHYFCSAIALLLVGAHLGLHLTMIGNLVFKGPHRSPLSKVLISCLAVAVAVVGIHSLSATSFNRRIMMPFQTMTSDRDGGRPDFNEQHPEDGQEFTRSKELSQEQALETDKNSEDRTFDQDSRPSRESSPEREEGGRHKTQPTPTPLLL